MRRDLKLLVDAIDMHAHTHPALFRRPIDDSDLAGLNVVETAKGIDDVMDRMAGQRESHGVHVEVATKQVAL